MMTALRRRRGDETIFAVDVAVEVVAVDVGAVRVCAGRVCAAGVRVDGAGDAAGGRA
jgi:hypothetical protein